MNPVPDNKQAVCSLDEVLVNTYEEAQDVLKKMDDIIAAYSFASVADWCDLIGVEASPTDDKYGWTDICEAQIIPLYGDFLIKMPRAYPID